MKRSSQQASDSNTNGNGSEPISASSGGGAGEIARSLRRNYAPSLVSSLRAVWFDSPYLSYSFNRITRSSRDACYTTLSVLCERRRAIIGNLPTYRRKKQISGLSQQTNFLKRYINTDV